MIKRNKVSETTSEKVKKKYKGSSNSSKKRTIPTKINAKDQKTSLKKYAPPAEFFLLLASKKGINPLSKAPSPNNLRSKFDSRKAIKNVATAGVTPKQKAMDKSRIIPVIRLINVPVKKCKALLATDSLLSVLSIVAS